MVISITVAAILFSLTPLQADSSMYQSQEGECEECHSEFEAFRITPDGPREVPEDYAFEYRVIIRNTWKHKVEDLKATIDLSNCQGVHLDIEGTPPYSSTTDDSVNMGSSDTHSFPVEEGAMSASIILEGSGGLVSLSDINLRVMGAKGGSWTSSGPGLDEEITLSMADLKEGGTGDYTAIVEHVRGVLSISYTLTIVVEYPQHPMTDTQEGPDLDRDDSHTFIWELRSDSKGTNTVKIEVTGTAYHDHDEEENPDSYIYTFNKESEIEVGTEYVYSKPTETVSTAEALWLSGRVLGFLNAFALIIAIGFSGIVKPIRKRLDNKLGSKRRIKLHCIISFIIIVITLVHVAVLYSGLYAGTSRGLVTGGLPLAFMFLLALSGVFQKQISKRFGGKNWRKGHLFLTILVVLLVCEHAFLEGTDLAFLRWW